MLATARRSAARRALTTGSATRAPLAPPYAHNVRPALAPPYTHPLVHVPEEQRLKAPYAFSLLKDRAPQLPATTPAEWAEALLQTEEGRAWAQSAWDNVLVELSEQPATVPEIPFQALTQVLADPATAALAARAGGVVVRDVVRDALAELWAAEMTETRQARSQPTYYHSAQVAARSDPSVLAATGAVLRSFIPGSLEGAYIRVDAATNSPLPSTWAAKNLWAVDDAAVPGTPVHAHLSLARSDLSVPTSVHAATYSLLRPYFTAKASRISFYNGKQYLDGANWILRENGADYSAEHVHVQKQTVSLAPGDVLVTHAGLGLAARDAAGLVLPVHPLPPTEGNKAFIALQRASFEAGLPPPHVDTTGSPVALEAAGDASSIESWGGRRAMGYGF